MSTPPTPSWLPAKDAAPDDAPMDTVLASIRMCARGWAPEARLLGNVRATDIVRAVDEAEAAVRRVATDQAPPLPQLQSQDWEPEYLETLCTQLAHLKTEVYVGGHDPDALKLGCLDTARRILMQLACAVRAESLVSDKPTSMPRQTIRM